MIEERIKTETNKNNPVPPLNRLLLTLRFYATGSFVISAGDFIGVSKATALYIIKDVTEAIVALKDRFIRMPNTPEEMNKISAEFFGLARFPRVIGTVDGTHIRIQSPGGQFAETFRNRKGYFSKNVQVVAAPNLEIQDIVTRWPGSAHDQTIFNGSFLEHRFRAQQFGNYCLLGDSGYECRSYLLTPLPRVMNPAENLYNESLIRTRQTVERLFGVWKRRFPILSLGIRVSGTNLVKADYCIVACAILHNIACKQGEQEPPVDNAFQGQPHQDEDYVLNDGPVENNPRYEVRRRLINGWFAEMA